MNQEKPNPEMFREDGGAALPQAPEAVPRAADESGPLSCKEPQSAGQAAALPQVVLIGDSIRLGYCQTVGQALAGRAEVVYPSENCRDTHAVITSLLGWSREWDAARVTLVHFNCGHWDIAHWGGDAESLTPVDCYRKNIGRIIARLRRLFPGAQIVYATTTPMNPDGSLGLNPRTTAEIIRYNGAGSAAAREQGAEINDLFAATAAWGPECYRDYCHFTPEAFERLGKITADFLESRLHEQMKANLSI